MEPWQAILIGIAAVAVVIIISNIHIVPQARVYVVERLGAYHATWGTGLHFSVPFIDKVAKRINKMEQVADFPPQPVITKDNVKMQIVFSKIVKITDKRDAL